MQQCGTSVPSMDMETLLREAAFVLGDRAVTAGDMDSMLDEIVRFEAHVGVVYRVLGFFTFVNTVWLFAIIGIAASIGPSVYHLLQPLHNALRRVVRHFSYIYEDSSIENEDSSLENEDSSMKS